MAKLKRIGRHRRIKGERMKKLVAQLAFTTVSLFIAAVSHAHGPAGTGVFAKADSAETVFTNPAGMSRLADTQMTLNGILAVNLSKFEVDENKTTVDGGDPRKPDPAMIPSFYYSRQFQDNWHFGYSLNVPTGFGASDGPNWAGRYYSDRSSLVYLALSPAMAYEFNENLSLGAGVRIMYTDVSILTKVNNNLIGDRYEDGRLKVTADGVGYGAALSALYSFSPDTRIGFIWSSQVNIDIDADVNFRDVRLPAEIIDDLQSQDIEVADNVPMTAGAGLYHRLQNDWDFTVDVLWVEFSKFGATSVSLAQGDLQLPKGLYNDFFTVMAGTSWPINAKMRGSVGAVWVQKPMDEDVRSFGIALDETWGIGAGFTYRLDNGNDIDFSVDILDIGNAPIDTGYSLTRGRVAGESKNPYALLIDFTYNWR
jgi:long-chain fatty acid transport protein